MNFASVTERLQAATLFLLALALFLVPAALAAALVLLWLGFLLLLPTSRSWTWWRDPAAQLVLALALYCPARMLLGQWLDDATAQTDWEAVGDWMQLAVVLPFALALGADERRLRWLLGLALLGLLIGMPLRLNWPLLLENPGAWLAWREGFGFTAIAFGLYSAAALLGVLLLRWPAGRFWSVARGLAALLLAQGLLLTQSRSAWLAFLIALGVGGWLRRQALYAYWCKWSARRFTRQAAVAGLLLLVFVGLNGALVVNRLAMEADSAAALLQQQAAPTDVSSIGLRWRVGQLGLDLWLQRPWFGWGTGAAEPLIAAHAQDYDLIDQGQVLVHLHNTYLELLVQLGVVGLGLFLALVAVLLHGVRAAWRQHLLRDDLAVLLICLFLLTLVWSLFSFRLLHQDWRGFWTLLAGAALSFTLGAHQRLGPVAGAKHVGSADSAGHAHAGDAGNAG
ncbi:O-antigen ligase family protein [Rhabdochromatium marinum]|uniref:O-antigen ligase family protein n=1 Tax=Rhabdochromatium marinum TaxID=48729 RepID=UPI0019041A51|nr:O-antigen ligase family protein [Rhabdochromatium marinum]MBK1648822.1 hypothetical protein [Rhabdochromatium marinum]